MMPNLSQFRQNCKDTSNDNCREDSWHWLCSQQSQKLFRKLKGESLKRGRFVYTPDVFLPKYIYPHLAKIEK